MASAGAFGLSVRADNFTGRVWSVLGRVVAVRVLTVGRPKADKQTAPTSRSQVILIGVSLSIVCAAIGVISTVFASRAPSFATPYGTSSEELSVDIVYISGVGLLVCAAVAILVTGWRDVKTESTEELDSLDADVVHEDEEWVDVAELK